MKSGKINERLSVGGQPTEDDLKKLKAEGFTTIINLRREGESNQPLDPAAEAKAAKDAGLTYVHIPVNSADPKSEQVEAVRAALAQSKGPAFVHCQGGGRACTMALLATAPASGYGSKEMMAQSEAVGFPVTNPVSVEFVGKILGHKG